MKNLIEIAGIVTKKKVRKIEIFDDNALRNKNSKFNEFYEALLANKFANDRDASWFLYECQPTDDKYRQLKSRFRKRLLNTLFFLDINTPSNSSFDRAYYSCQKDWTLVKILELNGAINAAADQASQMLTLALKYKFSDIILQCSTMLRNLAAEQQSEKVFEYHDKLIKQYLEIRNVEVQSEEYRQRVIMYYHSHERMTDGAIEEVEKYCEELVSKAKIYDSPVVGYNMYLVWIYRFEMCNDWESILEVCDRAESYVAEHPHYYQEGKVAAFYLKKMTAYLHLRDFKNGKLCVEKALKEFEDGQEIWFTILEYSLLLSLHTAHYLNALAILNLAVNHPKFKKLKVDQLDKWAVYHAYVDFFVESQEIQSNASSMSTKRLFKTGKLSSELIRFSKENRILDAHYMMAQLLFSLKRKNFSAASELVEKLVLFTTRQLKSDEYFRTIQFVRMIQQFEKANFKLQDLIKVEKYRQRLEDTPHVYRGRVSDLEIVPYEKLWKIVLEQA